MTPPVRSTGADPEPVLRVVKGTPTDEELAALLAALSLRTPAPTTSRDAAPSGWSAYWRTVRTPLQPGPGAWRASGRGW